MTITPENPLGLDGFEFVEFTSPDPARMKALIEQMGFTAYSRHKTKDVVRYKQGRINLLVNQEQAGQVAEFRSAHGPSANGMAFRVADAKSAYETALARGAKAADASQGVLGEGSYALEGIGGSLLSSPGSLPRRTASWRALPSSSVSRSFPPSSSRAPSALLLGVEPLALSRRHEDARNGAIRPSCVSS